MRALIPRLIRFNFNKNNSLGIFSWIKSLTLRSLILWILLIISVTTLVGRYLVYHYELSLLANQIEVTQGAIRENRSKVESDRSKNLGILEDAQYEAILKDLERNSRIVADLLIEVSQRIPQFAWLTLLHHSKGVLSLRGVAIDPLTVSSFAQALSNSPLISRLEIKGVKQIERSGVYLQEFSLEAMLR